MQNWGVAGSKPGQGLHKVTKAPEVVEVEILVPGRCLKWAPPWQNGCRSFEAVEGKDASAFRKNPPACEFGCRSVEIVEEGKAGNLRDCQGWFLWLSAGAAEALAGKGKHRVLVTESLIPLEG